MRASFPRTYPVAFNVQDWRQQAAGNPALMIPGGNVKAAYAVPVPVLRLPPQVPQYDRTLADLRNQ